MCGTYEMKERKRFEVDGEEGRKRVVVGRKKGKGRRRWQDLGDRSLNSVALVVLGD